MLKTLYKYIEYGGIIYERSYYSTLECRCYQPEYDLSLIFLISSGNYECYFSIVDDDFLFTKKCIYHENKPRVFLQLFCVSQITFAMICFYKAVEHQAHLYKQLKEAINNDEKISYLTCSTCQGKKQMGPFGDWLNLARFFWNKTFKYSKGWVPN
jgi:hypothetical protein